MRHICLPLLAVCSLLIGGAAGATRPHYGGTLRVKTSSTLVSLDPRDSDSVLRRNLSRLIFDTMVTLDDGGLPQPALATSWISSSANQHWQFNLRHDVTFSDGSALTSDAAAASLRRANPSWKVMAAGDIVSIDLDSPAQDFPAELALARNSIVHRDNKLLGTGPFVISQWDQGRKLALVARDDYWGGRAFLDSIEIEGGTNLRDQAIALELGKADLIEISPEQARRSATEAQHTTFSQPAELMALWFVQEAQSPAELRLREALSLSIDRNQLNRVLLQNNGEPAANILPNWMSGYSFLFSVDQNLVRAKQIRTEVGQSRTWALSYNSGDPLARVVAERIMLNARDAGLSVQPTTTSSADIRLIRIALASLDGHVTLSELTVRLGAPKLKFLNDSADSLYAGEYTLLQSRRIIPILHLRYVSGIGVDVKNWSLQSDGSWQMPQVWLAPQQP